MTEDEKGSREFLETVGPAIPSARQLVEAFQNKPAHATAMLFAFASVWSAKLAGWDRDRMVSTFAHAIEFAEIKGMAKAMRQGTTAPTAQKAAEK